MAYTQVNKQYMETISINSLLMMASAQYYLNCVLQLTYLLLTMASAKEIPAIWITNDIYLLLIMTSEEERLQYGLQFT